MGVVCPNTNSKVWKEMVAALGEPLSFYYFQANGGKMLSKSQLEEIQLSINSKSFDVLLPIGTSGSGKSTFIKSLSQENLVVIEPDAMRVEFTGDINDKSKDKEIYEEAAKRAIIAIKQGKQVVFDTTNLTKDKRLPFIEAIKKEIPTANIQYKLMELNPELAKQRIKAQIESYKLKKQNLFTVKPIQFADKKAVVKASVATQYIGFGEGIANSSTESYRQQANKYANTGNYSSNDIIFVSIGGKRGNEQVRKEQQNRTIREALKAIEAGATLITDNVKYIHTDNKGKVYDSNISVQEFTNTSGLYNEGEKRLYENLKAKGYYYLEQTVDGQLLGVWKKEKERANVPDSTIDRHAESYKQMLEDIKFEPITEYVGSTNMSTNTIVENTFDQQAFVDATKDLLIPGFSDRTQEQVVSFMTYYIINKIIAKNKEPKVWNSLLTSARNYFNSQKELLLQREGAATNVKIQRLVDQFNLIDANWDKFSSLTGERVQELLNNKFVEGNDLESENLLSEEALNDQIMYASFDDEASLHINHKLKLSKQLKLFLSNIVNHQLVTENELAVIKVSRNYLGLPEPLPYSVVYNALMEVLENADMSKEAILARVKSAEYKYPFMTQVYDKLQSAPNQVINAIQHSMVKHFINMKYVLTTTTNNETSHSVSDSNSSAAANMLLTEWSENFMDMPYVIFTPTLSTQATGELLSVNTSHPKFVELLNNLARFVEGEELPSREDTKQILQGFGVTLTEAGLTNLINRGLPTKKGNVTFASMWKGQGLFALTLKSLRSLNESTNLHDIGPFNKVRSLYTLAQADVPFKGKYYTNSFRAGDGKMVWGYSNPRHYVNEFVRIINNKDFIVDDLLELPFNSTSLWLKKIQSGDQNFISALDYFYFDVRRNKESGVGRKIREQGSKEHELSKIALFQNRGNNVVGFAYETLSDKKNMFGYTVPRFELIGMNNQSQGWLNTKGEISRKAIEFIFDNVVMPEIKRMVYLQSTETTTNIKGYADGSKLFYFLPELNNVEELFLEDNGYRFLRNDIEFEQGTLNSEVVLPQLKERIYDVIRVSLTNMVEAKMQGWAKDGITLKDMDKDYLNARVKSAVIASDEKSLLSYAALDMEINYLLFNTNLHQTTIGDPALYYKSKKTKSPVEQVKDTFNNMGKRLAADNASMQLLANSETDTFNLLVVDDKITKSSKYIEKLKEITGTDAQELTTLEEHLYVLERQGKITDKQAEDIKKTVDANQKLNYKQLNLVLQPVKPVYVANVIDKQSNVNKRVYVKSSSFPIIPGLVHGLEMEEILNFMNKHKINRLAYVSAVKIGSPVTPFKLWNKDGSLRDLTDVDPRTDGVNGSSTVLDNLPRSRHGIQQEVPYDEKKNTINDGTQQRSLLFLNALDKEFTYKDKQMKGHELRNEFSDIYGELFKMYFLDLTTKITDENNQVDVKKLQSLLVREGKERGYFINELRSLKLKDGEFEIPLYLNAASPKFEALLNSIVDNKIRKIKSFGKSFVLGTEEGFKPKTEIKTLEQLSKSTKSDIVFTSAFDVTEGLKPMRFESGEVKPAQVLIPWKFKDSFGKTLNIKDFMTEDNLIDVTKLPSELLEMFGFRIPTQKHVSMTYIEVVGFLPEGYGDLIIAPREFTKQMGSDFDVDKLYANMYAYYVKDEYFEVGDEQANLIEDYEKFINEPSYSKNLKRNIIRKDIKGFNPMIAKLNFADVNGYYYDVATDTFHEKLKSRKLVKFDFNEETLANTKSELIDLYTGKYAMSEDEKTSLENFANSLSKAREYSLMNQLMDVHKAVMLNPSMFDDINIALDYGKLRDDDNVSNSLYHFYDNLSQYESQGMFNGLTSEYQKRKYLNAKASKVAVGAFSSDSVFNANIQHSADKKIPPIRHGKYFEGKFIETVLRFGEEKSTTISDPKTARCNLKSDVIAAFQSAAVDDENQQILGKLGITVGDLDVIKALAQFGFEEDTIVHFINQPLIMEYKRMVEIGENADITSLMQSMYKSQANEAWKVYTKLESTPEAYSEVVNIGTKELQFLVENKSLIESNPALIAQQIGLALKYEELAIIGKQLRSLQSRLTIGSKGLDKEIVNNNTSWSKVIDLPFMSSFNGQQRLIGDYKSLLDPDTGNPLDDAVKQSYFNDGYIEISPSLALKPNTIAGHASVFVLGTNAKLWNKFYPYQSYGYSTVVSQFSNYVDEDNRAKEMVALNNLYKAYVFATIFSRRSSGNMTARREALLFNKYNAKGEITHHSLASIIRAVKDTEIGKRNSFLNNLETSIYKSNLDPSKVFIATNSIDPDQDKILLRGMVDLLANPRPIGTFNGVEYNTQRLVQELIELQYITGGSQRASQFIKYIPPEYLVHTGIAEELRNFDNTSLEIDKFVTQVLQHRPNLVFNMPEAAVPVIPDQFKKIVSTPLMYLLPKSPNNKYQKLLKVEKEGNIQLYGMSDEVVSEGYITYRQIDKLGDKDIFEIDVNTPSKYGQSALPKNKAMLNILEKNQRVTDNSPRNEETPVQLGASKYEGTLLDILTRIASTTTNPLNANTARELLKQAKQLKNITFEYTPLTIGAVIDRKDGKIVVKLNSNDASDPALQEANFLHELVHAVVDEKLLNPTTKGQKALVDEIQRLWTNFRVRVDQDKLNTLIAKVQKAKEQYLGLSADKTPVTFTKEEQEILYAGVDVREFVTMVMTSPELQKLLNETVDENGKSFWSQLLDFLVKFLGELGFNTNSEFATAYTSIISLINESETGVENTVDLNENLSLTVPELNNAKFNSVAELINSFELDKYDEAGQQEIVTVAFQLVLDQQPNFMEKLMQISDMTTITGLPDYMSDKVKAAANMLVKAMNTNLSINSSVEEIDRRFGLSSITGEKVVFRTGKLASTINGSIKNIQATAVPVENGYNIQLSIMTGLNPADIQRMSVIKRNLRSRNDLLYKAFLRAKIEKDMDLQHIYSQHITENELMLSSLEKELTIEDLASIAQSDIKYVQSLIKPNMTTTDVLLARKVVHMWMNAVDVFLVDSEKQSDLITNSLRAVEGEMRNLKEKLKAHQFRIMDKFVSDTLGRDISVQELFSNMTDISGMAKLSLDISRFDNEMLSAIFIVVKEEMYEAQNQAEEISRKINETVPEVLREVESITGQKTFDLFMQEYADGNRTGNLVFRYSQEYFETKRNLLRIAKSTDDTVAWAKYFQFLRENTVNFDVRKLMPTLPTDRYQYGEIFSQSDIDAHKAELIKHLGQKGYDVLIDALTEKVKRFQEEYADMFDYTVADPNNVTPAEQAILDDWDKKNSPYWYMHFMDQGGIPNINGVIIKPLGYKYTYNIPKRTDDTGKDLGWYDKKFEQIENNQVLLDFYELCLNTMRDISKFIPENKKVDIQINALPEIPTTLLEDYMASGVSAGLTPLWDRLKEAGRTDAMSEYTNKFYDPESGETEPQLRIDFVSQRKQKVAEIVERRILVYQTENNYAQPSPEMIAQFKREAYNEVAMNNSPDLGKLIKSYALMGLGYKHKSKIEDYLRIGKAILDEAQQSDMTASGLQKRTSEGVVHKLPETESFVNLKAAFDYYYHTFYGKAQKLEGQTKVKRYTSAEKKVKAELEEAIRNAESAFAAGQINDIQRDAIVQPAETQLRELGGYLTGHKVGNNAIKYMQLKAMAWNPFSGISNVIYGFISNTVNAADGRDFTSQQMKKAYRLITASLLKNWTFDQVSVGEAAKIRNMMDRFDVLKEASNEVYRTSRENVLNKNLAWMEPFSIQRRTEYINQATVMVAMAMNTKVQTPDGETTLWELMDENGNLQVANENDYKELLNRFRMKVDQVIKKTHGNYDTLSPLKIQETLLGRAGVQFRKWMLEGIASRFEGEKMDDVLGYERKGRYRSMWDLFVVKKNQNISRKEAFMYSLNSLGNQISYGLLKMQDNNDISEVDKANLRMNMRELLLYLQLITAALVIKALAGDDDEDETAKYVRNYLINHLSRAQTDITFYVSPTEFEALTMNPLPVTSIITDLGQWSNAIYRAIDGDDEIQTGIYAGESRLLRETSQLLPLGTSIYRNLSASRTEYK